MSFQLKVIEYIYRVRTSITLIFGIILTNSEGAEHVAQGIGQLLITSVHLQVNLTQIRRSVHANLHKGCVAAHLLPLLAAALLPGQHVLPEGPNRWPPHNLCPKIPISMNYSPALFICMVLVNDFIMRTTVFNRKKKRRKSKPKRLINSSLFPSI